MAKKDYVSNIKRVKISGNEYKEQFTGNENPLFRAWRCLVPVLWRPHDEAFVPYVIYLRAANIYEAYNGCCHYFRIWEKDEYRDENGTDYPHPEGNGAIVQISEEEWDEALKESLGYWRRYSYAGKMVQAFHFRKGEHWLPDGRPACMVGKVSVSVNSDWKTQLPGYAKEFVQRVDKNNNRK